MTFTVTILRPTGKRTQAHQRSNRQARAQVAMCLVDNGYATMTGAQAFARSLPVGTPTVHTESGLTFTMEMEV